MTTYRSLADLTDLPPGSVIMMHGECGTGKSYLSRQIASLLGAVRISSDEIRAELSPTRDESDQSVNHLVWPLFYERALAAIADRRIVVLDATHTDPRSRQRDVALYIEHGAREIVVVRVTSSPHIAAMRNRRRRRTVPETARTRIARLAALHPPSLGEGFDAVIHLINNNIGYYKR